jgi:hypothetical protein
LLAWQEHQEQSSYIMHMNKPRNKDKLVHSTFRIEQEVLRALDKEAIKRGISISSFVNKILKNYITSEMYFEELGFILVSKDFLRKVFARMDKKNLEEFGREFGLTIAKEYLSYFYPKVDCTTLTKFLDIWFKRFQSYNHRTQKQHDEDRHNIVHYFSLNHDINMNLSTALKAVLERLIEPLIKVDVKFGDITSSTVAFSFKINT